MQKSSILLLVVGLLIIVGLILSVIGNQIIFEDFEKNEAEIDTNKKLLVQKMMEESEKGIFAVEILELGDSMIYASIIDPFGSQIAYEQIDKDAYEGYFDIKYSGNYTLIVENKGDVEKFAIGYIGPQPDPAEQALAFVSMYILIIGLIGMIVSIIYLIVKRKKTS